VFAKFSAARARRVAPLAFAGSPFQLEDALQKLPTDEFPHLNASSARMRL